MNNSIDRIEKLEFIVAHLQSHMDDLNEVVVRMSKQLERLEREHGGLRQDQQALRQIVDTNQSLPHEKPPHY
jgi:uncharacterized coiled-coil protein SlyX